MNRQTFEHIKTISIPDPDFMPIFLQSCGESHVIDLQTWCAFLIDVDNLTAKRIDYPAWAWNVGSSPGTEPALTVYFERKRKLVNCPLDVESGVVSEGEVISEHLAFPTAHPPHLVTEKAFWYTHGGSEHSLIAARHDRITDLADDISRISPNDFFLPGPGGKVYLHRWDVGLLEPQAVDQPELVINYRKIGCREPRGASFDENGILWVLDEPGPTLFEIDMESRAVTVHDISALHRETDDPNDPSPYPWHSCIWCRGKLVIGCCDAARIDILSPITETS